MIRGFPRHAVNLNTPFSWIVRKFELCIKGCNCCVTTMLAFYWMFGSSSALQLRENTGSWEPKSTFGCCRFEYVKMMHGDASLWESFPQALER